MRKFMIRDGRTGHSCHRTPCDWLAVALLISAWGCGPSVTSAGETCPAVGKCFSDAGIRPELNPLCNADLSEYRLTSWREPSKPSTASHVGVQAHGLAAAFDFAQDLHNSTGETVWMTGEELLALDLELTLGSAEADPGSASVTLLLDGIVQEFNVQGSTYKAFEFPLRPGDIARYSVSVPAAAIAAGAHSGNILIWTAHGSFLGSFTFTVLHDSASFVNRPPVTAAKVVSVPADWATEVRRNRSALLLFGTNQPPDPDGSLPLNFSVTWTATAECSGVVNRLVLVAFLDNQQVPLGDLGLRPAVEVQAGQAARFDVVMQHLPPSDGTLHTLQIWQLTGDGAYSEAPAGQSSLWWGLPTQIGHLEW